MKWSHPKTLWQRIAGTESVTVLWLCIGEKWERNKPIYSVLQMPTGNGINCRWKLKKMCVRENDYASFSRVYIYTLWKTKTIVHVVWLFFPPHMQLHNAVSQTQERGRYTNQVAGGFWNQPATVIEHNPTLSDSPPRESVDDKTRCGYGFTDLTVCQLYSKLY